MKTIGNEEKDYYQKKKNEMVEKSKQSNALKAEFGIIPEESRGNNTNTNVRGKGRGRTGRGRGKKQHSVSKNRETETQDEPDDTALPKREKAEKQSTESGGQKRKDGPDDIAAGDRSLTKKLRSEEVVPEDDAVELAKEKQPTESAGQKRKVKPKDGSDDDVGSRSTKKSRVVSEVLSSSPERKHKDIDLNDPDGPQETPKLEITDE